MSVLMINYGIFITNEFITKPVVWYNDLFLHKLQPCEMYMCDLVPGVYCIGNLWG